jgi:O-antigen/teichoic acid export membrane protein
MISLSKQYLTDFFTKGDLRSLKAKKNIFASFGIKGISIAVTLMLVPLTINYVNPTQYGIWLTLSSIIGWFSFFDIGFGNGLRNRFAEEKAIGNLKNARIYISTTYAVLAIIFGATWIVFFFINHLVKWSAILNAPQSMAGELITLALIIISFFCLQIVLKTINTVLIADQNPAKSAFIDMLGQVLALILIVVLIKTTDGSLIYLGFALGAGPIIVLLASSFWFYNTQYKHYAPAFAFVNFSYARDIMKVGIKFFIIQIAFIVIYQTSNIIIAQIGGPEDVTIYNIAFKYFAVATMAFSIIITPFWSAFTDAFAVKDYSWMNKTLKKLRIVSFSLIVLVIVMTFMSGLAFELWVGEMVHIRNSISIVMALYVITTIWNSLHSLLLNGIGKIKLQLYVSLIGTFFNIPLAMFLGKKMGIEGVIAASLLLNLISAIYSPIQLNKIINRKAKGIWNE